jgi:hypothetical protein
MNLRTSFRSLLLLFVLASMVVFPAVVRAATTEATVTFRKVFKSSYPEFVEIKVENSGSGTWDIRQLDDDPNPHTFQLDNALVQKIFSLTAALHDFNGVNLEMHRRIANLGQKTFIFQNGDETHQVSFNYTLDPNAEQLLNVFEGLARQQTDLADLQRTMRYDRLGVNDIVMRIEKDYDQKLLPEPSVFLSSLDQLTGDEHFIDLARERARNLAERIRNSH